MIPVTNIDDNKEVSLLNGVNCVRALEPREVVYAFKTPLGWCVVGPMINQTKASKFSCNRIMFRSADTVNPESHYFTVPTEVREISIQNMLKKI